MSARDDAVGTAGPAGPGVAAAAAADAAERAVRRRLGAEVLIVLGVSLGQSGVYALVRLLAIATRGPVSAATATLNASRDDRPWLDLTYQLLEVVFALVPVALALYLLSEPGRSALRRIGLDRRRPLRDLGIGTALGALIGVPGLAFYLLGRQLGITADVVASGLFPYWWTVPVLVLAALKNALLEEVIVVGYLVERLERLGWPLAAVVVTSSVVRASYHAYQGYGPILGNAVMGVVFALYYLRSRRVMPLVVAHTLLDIVAFVGYALFGGALGLR
jgi:membrane protease YdiL (CAAX protease family)